MQKSSNEETAAWLEIVRQQVSSLRFGVVQVVVHDGNVVQIERTEKVRLSARSAKSDAVSASASAES